MAPNISRRQAMTLVVGGGLGLGLIRPSGAESIKATAVYPIAVPIYQSQFVAAAGGFFKDAGLTVNVVQGGSGVKAREIVASGNADIAIGDITHPMQLTNRGREARVVMPADIRNAALTFVIRRDLYDRNIRTLEQLVAWKRPDGRKPILGVSSLGGTTHVWASYMMEKMGFDQSVTWIGAGDVDTMLGMLKTRQVDVIAAAASLNVDAEAHGWGNLLFDGAAPENWDKYIGGPVPATAHFALKAVIDKDPAKMQACVTALWRATQWIKIHTAEQIYDVIQPFVGSTDRHANLFDIQIIRGVTDYTAIPDKISYERGAKVWFRDLTGIQPIPMDRIFDTQFVEAARKSYPG